MPRGLGVCSGCKKSWPLFGPDAVCRECLGEARDGG